MPKLLKKKNEKLAKEIVKTGHPATAYLNLHNCTKNSAKASVSKLIKNNPQIMLRVDELLDEHGLDDKNLAKKIAKMTGAKKEVIDSDGNIRQLTDNTTRMSAINLALKLKGHLQGTPLIDNRSVTIEGNSSVGIDNEQMIKALESIKSINEGLGLTQTHNSGDINPDDEPIDI